MYVCNQVIGAISIDQRNRQGLSAIQILSTWTEINPQHHDEASVKSSGKLLSLHSQQFSTLRRKDY